MTDAAALGAAISRTERERDGLAFMVNNTRITSGMPRKHIPVQPNLAASLTALSADLPRGLRPSQPT